MMINCLIIDDEQPAINILAAYVKNIPYLNLAGTTTNPLEGLDMVNNGNIDLIFLDIQMPNITGIEFIKAINGKCKVILTTAYSEYALEGFELSVIDYLLKPIPFVRFINAVQKARTLISSTASAMRLPDTDSQDGEFILLKGEAKGKLIKIETNEIDYFEGMRNYVAIYCGGRKTMALINLKDLEDRLQRSKFIRVHKSFIVAVSKIIAIEGNSIQLKNYSRNDILIGNAYKGAFLDAMKANLID